jgi:predicted transport protein
MRKKINKNITDEMFDGHPEKPLSKMTPREKIYYIWLNMQFKYDIKNRKFIKKDISNKK